jgi:hypothetical protein
MQERLTHRSGSELNRMSSVSHGQHLLARVEASGHAIRRHALARPAGLNLQINHSAYDSSALRKRHGVMLRRSMRAPFRDMRPPNRPPKQLPDQQSEPIARQSRLVPSCGRRTLLKTRAADSR